MTFPDELFDFFLSPQGEILKSDVDVWSKHYQNSLRKYCDLSDHKESLKLLFINYPEFRSLVDYRIASSLIKKRIEVAPQLARRANLSINLKSLGAGAFIQHGSSTWIFAKSIGDNFFINQNVTVGQGRGGAPKIGNNVIIRTGAVVVGNISIGNNVTINANSVVSFDVADDSTVYAARSVVIPNKR